MNFLLVLYLSHALQAVLDKQLQHPSSTWSRDPSTSLPSTPHSPTSEYWVICSVYDLLVFWEVFHPYFPSSCLWVLPYFWVFLRLTKIYFFFLEFECFSFYNTMELYTFYNVQQNTQKSLSAMNLSSHTTKVVGFLSIFLKILYEYITKYRYNSPFFHTYGSVWFTLGFFFFFM